jgi:hypothetical protein
MHTVRPVLRYGRDAWSVVGHAQIAARDGTRSSACARANAADGTPW